MIVLRKNPKFYYWLSENLELENHTLEPKVPQNFLVSGKIIDHTTPRILLYDSLPDAISVYGLGKKNLEGLVLGVYRPKVWKRDFRLPSKLENCPYRDTLEGTEFWCCIPIVLEKIADIRIGKKTETRGYRYGGRKYRGASVLSAGLDRYAWEEILPEWDKKGKTRKLL